MTGTRATSGRVVRRLWGAAAGVALGLCGGDVLDGDGDLDLDGGEAEAAAPAPAAAAAGGKFGYVDLERAALGTGDGKRAKAVLDAEVAEKSKVLEERKTALKKALDAYDKKKTVMSPAARAEEEARLVKMDEEIGVLAWTLRKELADREAALTDPILWRLTCILGKIGTSDGYTMIFNGSSLLWAPDYKDLTSEVVRKYEDGVCKDVKPPPAPKAAGTAAPKATGTAAPKAAGTAAPKGPGTTGPKAAGTAAPKGPGTTGPKAAGTAAPKAAATAAPKATGTAAPKTATAKSATAAPTPK
jgi:Skp family chaperone for outer membrane proteins